MSEVEYHTGYLRPIEMGDDSVETVAEDLCKLEGWELDLAYYDTWTEVLLDEGYDAYLVVDDQIYRMHDEELELHDSRSYLDGQGRIVYTAAFYNGGTCLSEVLEGLVRETV